MNTPILRLTTAMLTAGLAMAAAANTATARGNGFENEQRREAMMERLDNPATRTKEAFELADISAVIPAPDSSMATAAVADQGGPDHTQWTAPWATSQYDPVANANTFGR